MYIKHLERTGEGVSILAEVLLCAMRGRSIPPDRSSQPFICVGTRPSVYSLRSNEMLRVGSRCLPLLDFRRLPDMRLFQPSWRECSFQTNVCVRLGRSPCEKIHLAISTSGPPSRGWISAPARKTKPWQPAHSLRRASAGLMRSARSAGISVAMIPTVPSNIIVLPNTTGSCALTP
jgi:hypothetical protein